MYSLLLALIYIAFISLGLPDSLLGSGWPVIHNDLNVPISFMGVVSMVISGGTIVSSLFSDKLTRKLGARIVTVSSVFLTAVALFGFSFSDRFWMLIVFAVPYGLGIVIGTCILSCGVISLLIPTSYEIVSLLGFVVIGLGCAPIYPCIIHSTPDNFGAENSGAIIGIQMASAYVGSTLIPPLFGLLGNLIGFKILPVYLLVFIILMITMTELTFKVTAKKSDREENKS